MRWTVCIGVMALMAVSAVAQSPLTVTADRTTVRAGDSFMLNVEARGNDVSDPVLPQVDGLMIEPRPRRTADQMQVVLGGPRTVVKLRGYVVRTTRAGTFTIPPVSVQIDGQAHTSGPTEITVTAGMTPQMPQTSSPPPPDQNEPSQPGRAPTFDDVVFVEATVDKPEVYLGERVALTLTLWVLNMEGIGVEEAQQPDSPWPQTEGFYAVPQTPQRSNETRQQRNGFPYHVIQFQQMLYPTNVGDLTIGPWHWEGYARAWTQMGVQRKEYSLNTAPIAVKVNALPERPASFSGAVGQFDVTANVTSMGVVQGVPVKLVVRITGQGNPDAIGDPTLPTINGAYISEPEKKAQPVTGGTDLSVEKTFTYSITPQQPGTLEIPAFDYTHFNPETGQYTSTPLGPFSVQVTPSTESQQRILTGEALTKPETNGIQVLGQDIQPIIASPGSLRRFAPSPVTVPAAVTIPPLAYLAFALYVRRKHRFEHDTAYARAYHARSRAVKRIEHTSTAEDPISEIFHALTGYVADTFDLPEGGATSKDIERIFGKHGVDATVTTQFARVLRACERARYAGGSPTADEVRALRDAAHSAIDGAEDAIKRRSVS